MVKTLVFVLSSGTIKRLFKKPQLDEDYPFDDFVCNDLFRAIEFEVKSVVDELINDVKYNQLPSFKFREIKSGKEFYVQTVRFVRENFLTQFIWCNASQFVAFKNLAMPLYIIIGQGKDPYHPDFLYCIPSSVLQSTVVDKDVIAHYRVADKLEILKLLQ